MNPLALFESDLESCGVPAVRAQGLGQNYGRALRTRDPYDWIELYIGVFTTLRGTLERGTVRDSAGLDRLLLLVNDDLGCELFDESSRMSLRAWPAAGFRIVPEPDENVAVPPRF